MYNNASEIKSVFSERLEQIMAWNGVSNTELAESIGVNALTIKNAIKQISVPEAATICKIADFFAISVDWLLGRVDECDEIMAKGYFNAARLLSYEAYLLHSKKACKIDCGCYAPWPYNLAEDILDSDAFNDVMTADQADGLQYLLDKHISEREKDILLMRYKNEMTLEEISKKIHVGRERVRQIVAKTIRILRHPVHANYILNGLKGENNRRALKNLEIAYERECSNLEYAIKEKQDAKAKIEEATRNIKKIELETSMDICSMDLSKLDDSIDELDLSVRAFNCLRRKGIETIGDILELVKTNDAQADENEPAQHILYWNLLEIRNMGKRSAMEVVDKLINIGFLKDAV